MKKSLLLASVVLMLSCKNDKPEESTLATQEVKTEEMTPEKLSLKEQLDAKKAAFNEKADDEKKRIYAEGLQAVKNSGVLENAKNVGDEAIDFTLQNALGKNVNLKDYLAKGPVVLTWYRGGWCPYCNITLHELQEQIPNFNALNATILALTPEVPDKSISTKEKHNLEFEVLSDVGNKIGKKYGVVYKLTDDVANTYQKSFDLHGFNGDKSDELPLAATYVIDQSGKIQYAFLHEDYRNRAEPSDILEAIKNLK